VTNFLLGTAVFPALALLAGTVVLVRWLVRERILRLKPANPTRRAAVAARMFASKRAYTFLGRSLGVAVTIGHHHPVQHQAEAALLDEFVPMPEEV
jgi:hypothetical protein